MSKRGLPTDLRMRHDSHYVEELASRASIPVGKMIPTDKLEPNPNQPRTDMGELEELVASVRERGILEPLLVRASEVGGRYMIIAGERRYRAALRAGLREVPCVELNVDEQGVAEIALIENLQRKDLSPLEEAVGYRALAVRFGYTHEEIAAKVGKSRSSVTEALSLNSIPEKVKEECRRADIRSKSVLLEIVKQPSEQKMLAMIIQVRQRGLTRDELRQARSHRNKPAAFRYSFKPPDNRFFLSLRFRKSHVEKSEILKAIREAITSLK